MANPTVSRAGAWRIGTRGSPLALAQAHELRDRLCAAIPESERATTMVTTLVGSPAGEILRYATEQEVDLIVIGTHGRGAIGHMLLGSVTERVVRKAPCPVLTVRHPQHEFVSG